MAYDAKKAFQRIEDELIGSMMRNLQRYHLDWERAEGFDWSQWQVEQLKALEQLRRSNPKKYGGRFASINARIRKAIAEAEAKGQKEEERNILNALVDHKSLRKRISAGDRGTVQGAGDAFFRVNQSKLDALLDATEHDLQKAEQAVLRRANDQYRKIIFDAQVYANTGAGTVEKAVDMATKDFLAKGIDSIVYKNGARHTISDYADMYIRTAERRAYLMGQGQKRQEWGISLVIVNRRGPMKNGNRGHACPHCIPWLGKVLVDDVYSGGKPDRVHPLLSEAMAAGFLHPRCKDKPTTYFPGISSAPDPATKGEVREAVEAEKQENRENYARRQVEKFQRLENYSLDPENKRKYAARAGEWKGQLRIRQAEAEAKALKVDADYSQYTPELAEAVNQSIREVQEQFGPLEELKQVRTYHGDREGYAFFERKNGILYLRNTDKPDIMELMREDTEYEFRPGGWSTGDVRHAIVHELGHALEKQHLTADKRSELEKLRRTEVLRVTGDAETDLRRLLKSDIPEKRLWGARAKQDLSLYGLVSVEEMVSESLAQNILSEPGNIAQQVLLILMR